MNNSQSDLALTPPSALGRAAELSVLQGSDLPTQRATSDRVNILGVGAMPLDPDSAVATLDRWRVEGRREYVCLISVHGLVVAQRDPEIRNCLNRSGLACEDGMPLVWWSRLVGCSQARRVCGSDLLDLTMRIRPLPQISSLLLRRQPARARTPCRSTATTPSWLIVAGYRSPPFRPLTAAEDADDIATINDARPDFVWVGLGMPKQEKWMVNHLGKIEATALLGVGAAFDFHAGTKPRAPIWMQRSGLEWLFRLMTEPRRLAHRYLIDNGLFITFALKQALGLSAHKRDW